MGEHYEVIVSKLAEKDIDRITLQLYNLPSLLQTNLRLPSTKATKSVTLFCEEILFIALITTLASRGPAPKSLHHLPARLPPKGYQHTN